MLEHQVQMVNQEHQVMLENRDKQVPPVNQVQGDLLVTKEHKVHQALQELVFQVNKEPEVTQGQMVYQENQEPLVLWELQDFLDNQGMLVKGDHLDFQETQALEDYLELKVISVLKFTLFL